MEFAIPFTKNFKYFNQNIQLNINYKPKIKELNTFINAYQNYRINLIFSDFKEQRDLVIILALKEKYPQSKIIVCIPYYNQEIEQLLNKNNIQHYYSEFVITWDRFQGFLSLNITDIFISDILAFNLEKISYYAKKKNISLRCFCNLCDSSWEETPSLKTFFIRPEDLYLYAQYIDTFEFYTDTTNINTLYEIYTKDKKWFGKLNEILVGYEGEDDNKFIISSFGERRLNCGKRCMKDLPPTCQFCDRIIELSKTLEKRDIIVSR